MFRKPRELNRRSRQTAQSRVGTPQSASVILDASIAYGASRWYFRNTQRTANNSRSTHLSTDQEYFFELLQYFVLYNEIYVSVNGASARPQYDGFSSLLADRVSQRVIIDEPLLKQRELRLASGLCDFLKELLSAGSKTVADLKAVTVPKYYRDGSHVDTAFFRTLLKERRLPIGLLPFVIFAYRGICYAGEANARRTNDRSCVYLAAPSRLEALSLVLNAEDIAQFKATREEGRHILKELRVPNSGYRFSTFTTPWIRDVSEFRFELEQLAPEPALDFATSVRSSAEGERIRRTWSETLGDEKSLAMIGRAKRDVSLGVSNTNVGGNLVMIVGNISAT